MILDIPNESIPVLIAFALYLLGVIAFGVISHRFLNKSNFVKDYFVGGRGLGAWVLALSVAGTAVSGGTFMGFPSLIYSNGWIMMFWVAGYMIVPITTMILLGKRLNQMARISGAITIPDVFRDRFQSPLLGWVSTLFILFFMMFNLVAQFKAGALVFQEALRLNPPNAELLGAEITPDHFLLLQFNSQGENKVVRVPFPGKNAKYLNKEIDNEQRLVRCYFQEEKQGVTETICKNIRFPSAQLSIPFLNRKVEWGYFLGLILFALTVIGYTTYGGFWAVTWTDVFEGMIKLIGVILLAICAVRAVPMNAETGSSGLSAATESLAQQDIQLIYGPGPGQFLSLGMAISFFWLWTLTSPGQAGAMVRMIAFKDSTGLRKAMVLVSIYYVFIYFSLLIIFICARAIFPTEYLKDVGTDGQPDSIMPAMARKVAPTPFIAGLLIASPFAAMMSSVAAFLLLISSCLIRDIYQRSINPKASQKRLKIASYSITFITGLITIVIALNPPNFLQYIIVFTGSGQGAAFLWPMFFAIYWRYSTKQGILLGMIGGFATLVSLYVFGWVEYRVHHQEQHWLHHLFGWIPNWHDSRRDPFAPLNLFGFDPVVWGLIVSCLLTIIGSKLTKVDTVLQNRYFPANK